MRAWLVAAVFAAVLAGAALANPVNITIDKSEPVLLVQGESTDVVVSVKNLNSSTENYTVFVSTSYAYFNVNGTYGVQGATLTSIAASGSGTVTAPGVKALDNATFGESRSLTVEVYDQHGNRTTKDFTLTVPNFNTINSTLSYTASANANASLSINATTSNSKSTTAFNYTYRFYNDTGTCASSGANVTGNVTSTVDFANCSSGLYSYDVTAYAQSTSGTVTRLEAAKNFFLVRNVTFNVTLYAIEETGFERPYDEIPGKYVKGNTSMIARGWAHYDHGLGIGRSPDTSYNRVNATLGNDTYTTLIGTDGQWEFGFITPKNTSAYKMTLTIKAAHGLSTTKDVTVNVSNIRYLIGEPVEGGSIISKISIPDASPEISFNGGQVGFSVDNSGASLVTGSISAVQTEQYANLDISPSVTDSVPGLGSREFKLTVTPKPFTRPGSYPINLTFSSNYGKVSKLVSIFVAGQAEPADSVFAKRFVNYGPSSRVTLVIKNTKSSKVKATLRETIPKTIAPSVAEGFNFTAAFTVIPAATSAAIAACGTNETAMEQCKADAIIGIGVCADCNSVDPNATEARSACDSKCSNTTTRTRLATGPLEFSVPYTRAVEPDPVLEWEFDLEPGESREAAYNIPGNVDPSAFEEPVVSGITIVAPPVTPNETGNVTTNATVNVTGNATGNETAPPALGAFDIIFYIFLAFAALTFLLAVATAAWVGVSEKDMIDALGLAPKPKQKKPPEEKRGKKEEKPLPPPPLKKPEKPKAEKSEPFKLEEGGVEAIGKELVEE
jgi:hypothetical protein